MPYHKYISVSNVFITYSYQGHVLGQYDLKLNFTSLSGNRMFHYVRQLDHKYLNLSWMKMRTRTFKGLV